MPSTPPFAGPSLGFARAGAARLALAAGSLAVLLLVAPPLHAQAVRGRVVDDLNLVPVSTARVVLVRETVDGADTTRIDVGAVASDTSGYFTIPAPGEGSYRLRAERIGYVTTLSQAFDVEDTELVTVEFWLRPEAVLLKPVVVTARSSRGRSEFYRRMEEWGRGLFLTPEMVDSLDRLHPAELLEGLEKVRVTWRPGLLSTGEERLVPEVTTQLGNGCMAYVVDGRRATTPPWDPSSPWTKFPLDGVRGEDVVAVEVYRNIGEAPPELRNAASRIMPSLHGAENPLEETTSTNAWAPPEFACGLTVFWTKPAW